MLLCGLHIKHDDKLALEISSVEFSTPDPHKSRQDYFSGPPRLHLGNVDCSTITITTMQRQQAVRELSSTSSTQGD